MHGRVTAYKNRSVFGAAFHSRLRCGALKLKLQSEANEYPNIPQRP